MKTIKNKLSLENYNTEPVDDKEQNRYLRQTAYWVGYYIFEFNRLEDIVTNIAAEHIDGGLEKNDYAYIFLTGMMFNQKVELLERYYNFLIGIQNPKNADNLTKESKDIINELKRIGKNRNTIVHANYYSFDKNGNIKERTKFAGSDVEENWVAITREHLIEGINEIIDLIEKIENFDEDFDEAVFFG